MLTLREASGDGFGPHDTCGYRAAPRGRGQATMAAAAGK